MCNHFANKLIFYPPPQTHYVVVVHILCYNIYMEDVVKSILVDQIKEKHISVRELHGEIEKICDSDPSRQWFSLATLERRIQKPSDISGDELYLIRDAVKNIVSDSLWIHIRRHITETMRIKYAAKIDDAVRHGFALHRRLVNYSGFDNDDVFVKSIASFYITSPDHIKSWWSRYLETYLLLPDISKASLMCSSYIGNSLQRNVVNDAKLLKFIDFFPLFQGINMISKFSDDEIKLLGNLLLISANILDEKEIPDQYFDYAISKNNIPNYISAEPVSENDFVKLAMRYKHSVKDYAVDAKDFIHGICFILFIDRIEWLLAYATSVFYFMIQKTDKRQLVDREYHDRGCTGFRFTDRELDYLCELLYSMEN